jgi:hypothetical protein
MNSKISWAKLAGFLFAGSVLFSLVFASGVRKNTSHVQTIAAKPQQDAPIDTPRWEKAYAQLPLGFEENRGQAAREVRFVSHGSGYALALAPQEVDIAILRRKAMMATPLHRAAALRAYREARKALKPTATSAVVRMQLEGANPAPAIAASEKLLGKTNYFVGNDPKKWVTDVPSYGRVKYSEIYPGVDVEFYGNQRRLEYDFTVAPGANPKAITLKIDGAQKLAINSHGDLILHIPDGDVEFQKPVIYQMAGKERREVAGNYVLTAGNRVTFAAASYDRSLPLVIDPVLLSPLLSYATYLGGTGDENGNGIAVDAIGDAFIAGFTSSTDFPPTTNTAPVGGGCGFVTELNPAGASQIYSSYLCGTDAPGDSVFALTLDSNGKVYVAGLAVSGDFPTTANALIQAPITNPNGTAFVTKIDPTLTGAASLIYSSYVGGTNGDFANGVAADASGNAYIGGITFSSPGAIGSGGFTVMNAFQATPRNAFGTSFLTRIDTTQSGSAGLIYSTYLGGNGANNTSPFFPFGDQISAIAADGSHNAYVAGVTSSTDFPPVNAFQGTAVGANTGGGAFVARFDTTKSGAASLAYSTYLEGSVSDAALAIALGPNNVAYVTGTTNSLDFPTTPGAFQTSQSGHGVAFITLVDTTMSGNSSVPYSTFFGGTNGDTGFGIAADGNGNAYVVGTTQSGDFPITPNVIPRMIPNVQGSPFVLKLSPQGHGMADRIYASYFGGSGDGTNADQGNAIAVDSHGNAYITGTTMSSDMPFTTGAFQTALSGTSDAFVAKLPLLLPVLVSPDSLDFGTQLVGATTAPQTVTLTNNNSTALTINSITVVAVAPPAASTDFAIGANTCGASLAAGASCTVDVTFKPSVASAESAKLTFTDMDTSSPQSVTLTGTGTANAPVAMFTPTTLNLGSQLVTTTSSPAQTITLKNSGNLTMHIMSIAASGDFAQTNNCGATLTAGMSCTVSVTFTPTVTGARNGNISVTDDANGSPQTVALTGTGTDFTVTAPAAVTVNRHSSTMFNATVTPISGFNQAVTITCTGAPANATCTPMQASVTPDGMNPVNDPITVSTMSALPSAPIQVPPPSSKQIVLAAMGLGLLGMAFAMRRFQRRVGLAGALLFFFAIAGCGGNGHKSTTTNITVTGTVGTVTHSATVALTVN